MQETQLFVNQDTVKLFENPLVKEIVRTLEETGKLGDNFKMPLVMKNLVLMSPGVWNKRFFSKEEIIKGYERTDWEDGDNTSMFNDHKAETSKWLGRIINQRLDEETGTVYGDFVCYDLNEAYKLSQGKPKSGISPLVVGDDDGQTFKNFKFRNFSWVINPAVKTAYMFNSEGHSILTEEEMAQITNFEETRKKMGLSPAQFYAIPRDPPSESKLPIFDVAHVRNALARINQVKGISITEKTTAINKINAAAKKFNVTVSQNQSGGAKMSDETKINELAEFSKFHEEYKIKHTDATFNEISMAYIKLHEEEKTEGSQETKEEKKDETSTDEKTEETKTEGEEKMSEKLDLNGLTYANQVKTLETKLADLKSNAPAETKISKMQETVKALSQEVEKLRETKETAEKLSTQEISETKTRLTLSDEIENESAGNMIKYLQEKYKGDLL